MKKERKSKKKIDGEIMVPPQEPEQDPQAIIEQILKNVGANSPPPQPIDPIMAAIQFVITASGNLEVYSTWAGTSTSTKKKFIKLFALIHSGKLVDVNAQEILALCQKMNMTSFGMDLINKAHAVLTDVDNQPAIQPLEVLGQSLIHKG